MALSSWQKEKINMLAEYQESLSELYTYYSERYPEQQEFWLDLALPKLRYADWLRLCLRKIEDGKYRYNMMRFKIESIRTGLEYIRKQIRDVWYLEISFPTALAMALSVETGLIASRFYEIVDPPADDALGIVNGFKTEMRDRLLMIRRAMIVQSHSRVHVG